MEPFILFLKVVGIFILMICVVIFIVHATNYFQKKSQKNEQKRHPENW
jgi:uncharacterized membrane protein YbaN (DUF454 family)